ncbi:MAG TPA: hypothetical protein VII06_14830 [Chloroflexota bacterium]|jgi:hypothetical protein
MAAQPIGRRRDAAVVILTGLALVSGLLEVVDVLRFLGILPMGEIFGLQFYGVNWLGALLSGIVAVIWFSVVRQLWNLDPQGWLFVVVIAILNLALLLAAVVGRTTFQAVSLSAVVNAAALILALLPSTQAAFGRR